MDKKIKVKINIIEGFYNIFLLDILILLFGIIIVMATQEIISLIILNLGILLLIIFVVTLLCCLTIYIVVQEEAVFSKNKIIFNKHNKNIEVTKEMIDKIEYINNKWYQLPLMYFHNGGWLSITYKNENNSIKIIKIRLFGLVKRHIENDLGYKIDITPNKFTWSR